jgi:hypothetical protein
VWERTAAPLLRFLEISCQRANDCAVLMASLEVGAAPSLKRCAPPMGSSRCILKRPYSTIVTRTLRQPSRGEIPNQEVLRTSYYQDLLITPGGLEVCRSHPDQLAGYCPISLSAPSYVSSPSPLLFKGIGMVMMDLWGI